MKIKLPVNRPYYISIGYTTVLILSVFSFLFSQMGCNNRTLEKINLEGSWSNIKLNNTQFLEFYDNSNANYVITDESTQKKRNIFNLKILPKAAQKDYISAYLKSGSTIVSECKIILLDKNHFVLTRYKPSGHIDGNAIFRRGSDIFNYGTARDSLFIPKEINGRFTILYSTNKINCLKSVSHTYHFKQKFLEVKHAIDPTKYLFERRSIFESSSNSKITILYPWQTDLIKSMPLDSTVILSFGFNQISSKLAFERDSIQHAGEIEYFFKGTIESILKEEYLFK